MKFFYGLGFTGICAAILFSLALSGNFGAKAQQVACTDVLGQNVVGIQCVPVIGSPSPGALLFYVSASNRWTPLNGANMPTSCTGYATGSGVFYVQSNTVKTC